MTARPLLAVQPPISAAPGTTVGCRRKRTKRILVTALCFLSSSHGTADPGEPLPLFRTAAPLEVTINAPWRAIVRDRRNQDPYPALIQYLTESGEHEQLTLTVERRGRLRQKVCRFPPIMLRFARQDIEGTPFEGDKSIKMVTHCDNGNRWEQYYILEMLAYQIYNLITERSFRIRPLTVTYRDNRSERDDGPHFAFLIEDEKHVAKRNGLKKFELPEIHPARLDPAESSRFALFQYLIGNVDWSALGGPPGEDCCHNAKLIGPESGQPLYAVPYDFDSSGLVNASYAAPGEHLPISRVTERLFRGFCMHNATLDSARLEFMAQQRAIEEIIEREPRLTPRTRSRALKYLSKFYEVLEDPAKFARKITNACRK